MKGSMEYMTEKRWSFSGGVIVGTDICEKGIPHTNRSIVTHLNRYERKIKELEEENEKLKKMGKVSLKDAQLLAKGHKRYRKIIESLKDENEQLKKELQKYTEIHFRNENGTHTVLYEKKE